MSFFTATPIGTRIVVRYRLDDGMATDAVGCLQSVDATHCTLDTPRGLARIAIADVIAAKQVPPPPPPRSRRITAA